MAAASANRFHCATAAPTFHLKANLMADHDFISRRPRHEAEPDAPCRLILRLNRSGTVHAACLADLSRQGLKVVLAEKLPTDERVRVEAELPNGPLQLTGDARIRWVRLQDDGQWAAGLLFGQDLAWEVMGELFLNGVLSRDNP